MKVIEVTNLSTKTSALKIRKKQIDMSTQFLQFQKNQLIDLKQHFERCVNTLPVMGLTAEDMI